MANNTFLKQQLATCSTRISIMRLSNSDISGGFDVCIEKIKNLDVLGQSRDLSNNMIKMEVTNSVRGLFKTATLLIQDRDNLRETLPLTGNEIIAISYNNVCNEANAVAPTTLFSIASVSDQPNIIAGNAHEHQERILALTLVEFPIYNFLVNVPIYKTYKWNQETHKPNISPSEVLHDSLSQIENIGKWYDIDAAITPTKKTINNLYIPNWHIMDVIKYLQPLSTSMTDTGNYIFGTRETLKSHVTKPQIVFQPMLEYYSKHSEDTIRNYNTVEFLLERTDGPVSYNMSLKDYVSSISIDYGNVLKRSFSKMSGHTFATMDYQADNNYLAADFDHYIKNEHKHISPYTLHTNKYGNQYGNFNSHPISNPTEILTPLKNQYSRLLMETGVTLNLTTYVNENRTVGEKGRLYIPSYNNESDDRNIPQYDKMFSGEYMTWAITDVITRETCHSNITMISDSFKPTFGDVNKGLADVCKSKEMEQKG